MHCIVDNANKVNKLPAKFIHFWISYSVSNMLLKLFHENLSMRRSLFLESVAGTTMTIYTPIYP